MTTSLLFKCGLLLSSLPVASASLAISNYVSPSKIFICPTAAAGAGHGKFFKAMDVDQDGLMDVIYGACPFWGTDKKGENFQPELIFDWDLLSLWTKSFCGGRPMILAPA